MEAGADQDRETCALPEAAERDWGGEEVEVVTVTVTQVCAVEAPLLLDAVSV